VEHQSPGRRRHTPVKGWPMPVLGASDEQYVHQGMSWIVVFCYETTGLTLRSRKSFGRTAIKDTIVYLPTPLSAKPHRQ